MAPIRKGDGTGLAAKGYSQVRKGDGTVLWNAILASVRVHYLMDEGSGSTLADDTGNNDGTLFGAGWGENSNAVGDWETTYDGTNDYGEADGTENLLPNDFTVILTVEPRDLSNDFIAIINKGQSHFGSDPSSRPGVWSMQYSGSNAVVLQYDDDGSSETVDSSTVISENTKYQFTGRIESNVEAAVAVNGSIEDTQAMSGDIGSDTDYPITWSRDPERDDFYHDCKIGTIEFYDTALSDDEIQRRYDSRPWS